ncbi:exodeoxyribonuclease 1 [Blumeria hordei DH14]|uniref:Exodeoxyribonuclease 1 n=1 Tax=Blumeria graminis f. sp. hordei (strain DH14) TaxID=546991 RepID=N1J6P1_BLUG1|nr:exodeoxyribonuclease 1 [Blumeria hordei DH14]
MGISGLLRILKSIQKPCHLSEFEGKTLGVDAYGWLHRGIVTCATELAIGKPTKRFVDSAMHRVRMLQHFGVIPFLIFDGDHLPGKATTEEDRAKRREESRKAGLSLLHAGKSSQAHNEFQKSIDVTPEMARQLIDELRKHNVQYVVAPYEADSQMVYMEGKGIIDGIISEDSDLLVFGARCLLTKLDQYGNCIEVNKKDFSACTEINLAGWSDVAFRQMAILSGCDYLASVNKMGLKTAYRMLRRYKTVEKVIQMLRFDGNFKVPDDYLESFRQAELTFLHQRVFCPISMEVVLHTQPTEPLDLDKMTYIGAHVEPKIAQGVATGDLHPMTKQPIIVVKNNQIIADQATHSGTRIKHRSISSTPDLGKCSTITAFFKARTPLAELDPNCFTPSPRQSLISERSPRTLLSRSVPQPNRNRLSAEAHHIGSGILPMTQCASISNASPRPRKKARLCDDTEYGMCDSVALCSSRFFSSQTPQSSPTSGKPSIQGMEDAKIFSDDSIEEAMLSLPSTSLSFESNESLDRTIDINCSEDNDSKFCESPPTVASSLVEQYKFSSSSAPAKEVWLNKLTLPPPKLDLQETLNDQQPNIAQPKIENLQNKFSEVPDATSSVSNANTLPGQISVMPPHRPSLKKQRLTPLQSISASVKNRMRLSLKPLGDPIGIVVDRPRGVSTGGDNSPLKTKFHRKGSVTPVSNSQGTSESLDKILLGTTMGSEDLVIHDSEDEALSPIESCQNSSNFGMDIQSFMYSK